MERRTSRLSVDPARLELLGAAGQCGVEVEGVGQVEHALDPGGAGVGDVVVVDRDVPLLGRGLGFLPSAVGFEAGDRLGDQPFDDHGAGLVRERGELGVDEPGSLEAESDGLLGDPPGPPRRAGHRRRRGPRSSGAGRRARPPARSAHGRRRWSRRWRGRTRRGRTPPPAVRPVRRSRSPARRRGPRWRRRGWTRLGAGPPMRRRPAGRLLRPGEHRLDAARAYSSTAVAVSSSAVVVMVQSKHRPLTEPP